ncbi:ER membrane protein complex subunit 8-like [Python bivittatus]|uniref:ER membrane protein complex subunit 8-like n=1 Tax=Python bivittatus TaxID=176946 RepID=A0A9F5IK85_PYTBI|nr:ER membrane protein complex subunit 8-like [Python bivittatus]
MAALAGDSSICDVTKISKENLLTLTMEIGVGISIDPINAWMGEMEALYPVLNSVEELDLLTLDHTEAKLTTEAYCKMVLHGAKYPHCAIKGLLVAEKQPPHHRGHKWELPPHIFFVDCLLLFHGSLALAPMLEVVLSLIDSWCTENSYVIAGYYQSNEHVKDTSPNLLAEKVTSRIAESFSDMALIIVDNTKFTKKCLKPAVHVYERHENKWRCRDPHIDYCEDWTEAQRISQSLLDSQS